MRAEIWCVVCIALKLFLTGCAYVLPTAVISYPETTSPKDVVAATSVVLQERDFPIMTVNENIGVIVTDWKKTSYNSRMKLTITTDIQNRKVNLKPFKQEFNKKDGSWSDDLFLADDDQRKLNSLIEEICKRIGVSVEGVV